MPIGGGIAVTPAHLSVKIAADARAALRLGLAASSA